ncbi:hypothetical protein EDB19DRAFT_1990919 [Suillus lakei]|nr:hypothetical protein EDB19DRAFT_1990919 [Suillus lakei]
MNSSSASTIKVMAIPNSSNVCRGVEAGAPGTGISNKVMVILNSFVNDIFGHIELAVYSKKSTIFSNIRYDLFYPAMASQKTSQAVVLTPFPFL